MNISKYVKKLHLLTNLSSEIFQASCWFEMAPLRLLAVTPNTAASQQNSVLWSCSFKWALRDSTWRSPAPSHQQQQKNWSEWWMTYCYCPNSPLDEEHGPDRTWSITLPASVMDHNTDMTLTWGSKLGPGPELFHQNQREVLQQKLGWIRATWPSLVTGSPCISVNNKQSSLIRTITTQTKQQLIDCPHFIYFYTSFTLICFRNILRHDLSDFWFYRCSALGKIALWFHPLGYLKAQTNLELCIHVHTVMFNDNENYFSVYWCQVKMLTFSMVTMLW